MCFFSRAAGPLYNPVRSGIWYHFFPEGEQVSARPRFCILTCIAHDIRWQWFQLIFWGPYRPMGFFLKIGSPMYFFNHIIYIYIITIIVYFIKTYIYIIKTSHVLLTYKSKCLTEVGKENPGCFWLTRKENPGDCVQKLAKILRTNVIITRSFLFWATTHYFVNYVYKKCASPVYFWY